MCFKAKPQRRCFFTRTIGFRNCHLQLKEQIQIFHNMRQECNPGRTPSHCKRWRIRHQPGDDWHCSSSASCSCSCSRSCSKEAVRKRSISYLRFQSAASSRALPLLSANCRRAFSTAASSGRIPDEHSTWRPLLGSSTNSYANLTRSQIKGKLHDTQCSREKEY